MWFGSKKTDQKNQENKEEKINEEKQKLVNKDKDTFAKRKDIKDLITPGGIDATFTNHLEIISTKTKFARSMVVTTLPRTTVFPELFRGLYEANDANTSIFINPISNERSLKSLNSQINEIESEIIVARNRHDVNRERTLEIKKEELEQWRDKIDAGYDSMFTSSIITTTFAPGTEALDLATSQIITDTGAKLITIKPAWAIQDEAFISNMPFNENKINIEHNFDKGSMGTVFPFITSDVGHTSGIPLGYNLSTGLPVLFDNFDKSLENYNMVIFGKSGAGKGVTIKTISARSYALQGIESLSLDAEGEYGPVAESLGGINIVISPTSGTIINLFDVEPERVINEFTKEEEIVVNLDAKIEDVTQSLITMARGSTRSTDVNEVTKTIISELVRAEYEAFGITTEVKSLYKNEIYEVDLSKIGAGQEKKEMPTIGTWYKRLLNAAKSNKVKDYDFHFNYLTKVMKQYVREEGGQLGYFDGQSTFDLQDHISFINLDISRLEEKFARPLAQQVLLSWIWEKYVKKNSEDRTKATKKRVIVDEAWMLLPYPEAADFLDKMARRARKRNVSLAVVSQRFQDFYESKQAQAVLTSSKSKLFLGQDTAEIDYLKEVFKLSESEASYLSTCTVGQGLLKIGEDTALIQIRPTQQELEFVNTNVNEQVANFKRKQEQNKEQ